MANPIDNIRNQTSVSAVRETERLDKTNLRKAQESADRRSNELAEKLLKEYNVLKQKVKESADKDISNKYRLRKRLKPDEQGESAVVLVHRLETLGPNVFKIDGADSLRKKIIADNLLDMQLESEANTQLRSYANTKFESEINAKRKSEVQLQINTEVNAGLDAEVNARLDAEVNAGLDAEVNARLDTEANARLDAEANARLDADINAKLATDNVLQDEKRKQQDNIESQSALLNYGARPEQNQQTAAKDLLADIATKQSVVSIPESEQKPASGPDKQFNYPFKSWQGDPSVNVAVQSDAAVAQASDDQVQRALREHQSDWQHNKPLIVATQNNDHGKGQNTYQPSPDESGDDE